MAPTRLQSGSVRRAAQSLGLKADTVKKHLQALCRRTGAKNFSELMAYVLRDSR